MNPRSLLAHHLPTLTEVVDEASIPDRAFEVPVLADAAWVAPPAPVAAPAIDLSDDVAIAFRTPTPQEVERLRGDDAPFEATISDHQIRRALAEAEAEAAALAAAQVDLPIAEAVAPPVDEAGDLVESVMADVQRQVDALLEHRLREALAPVLAQVVDTLAAEARELLASSLRDLVSQAVANEIERLRAR